jgi:hypothetical protein
MPSSMHCTRYTLHSLYTALARYSADAIIIHCTRYTLYSLYNVLYSLYTVMYSLSSSHYRYSADAIITLRVGRQHDPAGGEGPRIRSEV